MRHVAEKVSLGWDGASDLGGLVSGGASAPPHRRAPAIWWSILALIGLVAAAYGQTLHFEFVLGDHDHILSNGFIRGPIGWQEVFTSPTSAFLPQMPGVDRAYRPLLALSLAADWAMWRMRPGGFHLSNVLVHLAVVLLLWCIARRLTGSAVVAFTAAALLAVHPSAVEPVTYIAARMDLYVGLGIAATMLLLHGCLTRQGRAGTWRLLGALLCFIFSLGAKETAMMIPVLVAWTAWVYPEWLGERRAAPRWSAVACCVVPFWVVLGCYVAFRLTVVGTLAPGPAPFANVPSQALRAMAAIGRYAQMLIAPGPGTGFLLVTRLSPPGGVLDWPVPLGLVAILLVGVGLLSLARHSPVLAFALGWAAVALVPAANFLPIYWEHEIYVAERSLYPALPGWCLFLAIGVYALIARGTEPTRVGRSRRGLIVAIAIGGLLVVTSLKVGAWRDDVTLWRTAFAANPGHLEVRLNLAAALAQAGDLSEADAVVQETSSMAPGHPDVAYVAGWIAELRGERVEALRQYERAIATGTIRWQAFRQAAILAVRLQDFDRAARWFSVAANAFPQAAWPQIGIGWYHQQRGRQDLARMHYDRATRLEPASPERPALLGQLLQAEGRTQEALSAFRAALALDPGYVPANRGMALLLEQEGRAAEAMECWQSVAASLPPSYRSEALQHLRQLRAALASTSSGKPEEDGRLAVPTSGEGHGDPSSPR